MIIKVSSKDIERCVKFSNECAQYQQRIEFGQGDTRERSIKEISRDNLIGKLAEVAFAKMLQRGYNITAELDFNIYPKGVWDNEDIKIGKWRIDVKGTRSGAEWMLIEWNKLRFRQRENKLAHIYVMAEVGWDRKKNKPTGTVELIGYTHLEELKRGVDGTYILKKGKKLPGKNVILQADNFGRPFRVLHKDWNELIDRIKNDTPPNTAEYEIP